MYSKKIAIALTVVIIALSFITYSISDNSLAYTILLIVVWFPMGIAIFIDLIKFQDEFFAKKDQSKISQLYMGIKFLFGLVVFIVGIYSLYHFIVDPPIGFSDKIIILILIIGILIYGFRISANAYLSFTGKEIS